jgi:hypothetical protein
MARRARKASAQASGEKKAAAKTATPRRRIGKSTEMQVTPENRRSMIELGAYARAERRGFVGGDTVDDWLRAEAEVDALLLKEGRRFEAPA